MELILEVCDEQTSGSRLAGKIRDANAPDSTVVRRSCYSRDIGVNTKQLAR